MSPLEQTRAPSDQALRAKRHFLTSRGPWLPGSEGGETSEELAKVERAALSGGVSATQGKAGGHSGENGGFLLLHGTAYIKMWFEKHT